MSRAGLLIATVCTSCGFEVSVGSTDGPLPPDDRPPDTQMLGACDAVQVTSGHGEHSCARTGDDAVYCWGRNDAKQLGVPQEDRCAGVAPTQYCSPSPHKLAIADATDLAIGQYHTCATTAAGTYCWGMNTFGQYGNGNTSALDPPGIVSQRQNATRIEAGVFHTCSLNGSFVSCSGKNDAGEVGDNSIMQQNTASQVFSTAVTISAGAYSSCAIDAQLELWCWGRNDYKQIDNTQLPLRTPTKVTGITASEIAVGVNHLCAVTSNQAQCWGSNAFGQLGNGMTSGSPTPPTLVGVSDVREVSTGPYHTCVRDGAGAVWCFGYGYTSSPVRVALPRPALQITSGVSHDCAVTDDHKVYCWGDQTYGQLGNDVSSTTREMTPQLARLCP